MEDYKKKYEDALERAKKYYNRELYAECNGSLVEDIFPELKESEDERIRKEILQSIQDNMCVIHKDKCISWLEKQDSIGKINEKLRQYREYLVEETERWHKKEEDETLSKIGKQDCIGHANAYVSARAEFEEIFDYESWLQKQGKPQVRTGIEWVNTIDDACEHRYAEEYAHGEYCHEQSFRWGFQEGVDWLEKQGEQKPTDKVEISTFKDKLLELFQKFRWKGIQTNGDIIEYVDTHIQELINTIQKPSWSEDTQQWIDAIVKDYEELYNTNKDHRTTIQAKISILKSLKDRVQPQQKQEWSKEDEEMFDAIIADIQFTQKAHTHDDNQVVYEREIDWLKSLKERYTWKPSVEQDVIGMLVNLGYPVSTNGEIPTYEDTFNDCKNAILHCLQEKVDRVIINKRISLSSEGINTETLLKDTYMQAYRNGIDDIIKQLKETCN